MDTTPSYPLSYADALPLVREWFSRPDAVYGYVPGEDDLPGQCVYRGGGYHASEVRCSIGCLIPDHVYLPEMENMMAAGLIGDVSEVPSGQCFASLSGTLAQRDVGDFQAMQGVHDKCAAAGQTVAEFVAWLTREIAKVSA